MEKFSKYSLALFGLVAECFKEITKLEVLSNGLFRLSLRNIRFYASGLERDPAILKLYKKLGGKYIFMNYFQCVKSSKWLDYLEEFDLYTLIESGSFSEFNQKRKKLKKQVQQQELFDDELFHDITIKGYAIS